LLRFFPPLSLPLSFDPEALDGEGGGQGGGDFLWLRLCHAALLRFKKFAWGKDKSRSESQFLRLLEKRIVDSLVQIDAAQEKVGTKSPLSI